MRRVLLLILAAALTAAPLQAAETYVGKTIELIDGAPPGGGYDIYARAVARQLGRTSPGGPNTGVKNMPGAATPNGAPLGPTTAPPNGTSARRPAPAR